jgi:ATP-binding cassette subfamily B protein
VVLIAILIILSAALELVAPLLSKSIIDEVVLKIQNKGGDVQRVAFLVGIAFGANLLGIIFSSISDRLGDHFAGRLFKYLTEKFYQKILTLPQSYFDSELSGKIINQLNRGIAVIQGFVNVFSNFILPTFLQSVFTIVVMAYYNIPTALFTFSLFPIYLILSYYSSKKWGAEEIKKNKIADISKGRIQEVVSNIKVVKSFNNEKKEFEIVEQQLNDINKIYAGQSTTFHLFDFLRDLSLNIVLLIINIIIVSATFQKQLSVGEMVLIIQLINQARRPLFAMSFILTQLQNAESGSKEFFEILGIASQENYLNEPTFLKKIKSPVLEFVKVNFKYENSEIILSDISFKIGSGKQVALVGPSGTGKTTIVNLILKLYEPTSGKILLNNKSYRDLPHGFIRRNIALVFQENELFSSTIRENVAYGNNATDLAISQALKEANAYDFVEKLPKGIDTEVGERGIKLSGGQKQRIQIARAILKNSPILILDEATSNLDARSEMEVQKAMENLIKGRLTIIIAHRFSTIQNVDKIIVLDQGSVVDCGTPKELSQKKGIYSDLLRYQIEGNKKLLEKFEIY